MVTEHALTNEEDAQTEASRPNLLKVLIVGDSATLEESRQLLNSLEIIGYGISVLGAVTSGAVASDRPHEEQTGTDNHVVEQVRKRVERFPPDLVILTTEDQNLRREIKSLIPTHATLLDSFVLKIIKGLRDVSGQLAATRTKLETVELIKEVLMSGPEVSIMVVDEDLNTLEINNAILGRTRASSEDCIGRPCHWVLRKELKPCFLSGESCVVRDVLRTGRSVHTVREEQRKDDTLSYFTISAYPLGKDERGKKNVLIVWKDVTRGMAPVMNRQAQNIRDSFFHALRQDKMVALGKLASAAVHEINNPIQGVLTFAKLMRQAFEKESLTKEEMENFRSYLDLIATESARCGRILQNLLSFARQGDLERTAVDLPRLFQDIVLLMGNRMKLQGISLCLETGDQVPPVYGDRDQIKQALLNIVLNSVEAMPDGGLITISADLDVDGKHVVIRIQDTGPGIPKHIHGNIFEPFFTTKGDGKGVGLGLSVVYGVMSQHGATIDVESQDGEGTTFILNLPVSDEFQGTN